MNKGRVFYRLFSSFSIQQVRPRQVLCWGWNGKTLLHCPVRVATRFEVEEVSLCRAKTEKDSDLNHRPVRKKARVK